MAAKKMAGMPTANAIGTLKLNTFACTGSLGVAAFAVAQPLANSAIDCNLPAWGNSRAAHRPGLPATAPRCGRKPRCPTRPLAQRVSRALGFAVNMVL